MAESTPNKKKLVIKRKHETVRERATKSSERRSREPRRRKLTSSVNIPFNKFRDFLSKEVHIIKTNESKAGRFLGRKGSIVPKYFKESFRELKLVTWPKRRVALRLTLAVLVFSVVIASAVTAMDYGFDRLFKEVILR